jgi:hypothetical protein
MMRHNEWQATLHRVQESNQSDIDGIYLLSSMPDETKQEVLNEFLQTLADEDNIQLIRVRC